MKNNPEYFFKITYLRAFAILAVISIHVSSYSTEMTGVTFLTLLYLSIDTFSHFAVPLFVCISGFLLYHTYHGLFSLKTFYKNRFLSVVPQYTLFSILGILFTYFGYRYSGKIWSFTIGDLLYRYVTGTALYHLWFFVLIIQLYLLYPVIEKVFMKSNPNHRTPIVLIFLFIIQILYQIFSIRNIFLVGTFTLFLPYTFYFVLGMYAKSRYLDCRNMLISFNHSYIFFLALLSATVLGIGSYGIDYFKNNLDLPLIYICKWTSAIVTPFYYILIFILCLYLSFNISDRVPDMMTKWLQKIGNYSFGIYLIHAFILYIFIEVLFPKLGFTINNWLFFPITSILVLSLSMMFVCIINTFPYHEYIIGRLR